MMSWGYDAVLWDSTSHDDTDDDNYSDVDKPVELSGAGIQNSLARNDPGLERFDFSIDKRAALTVQTPFNIVKNTIPTHDSFRPPFEKVRKPVRQAVRIVST